MSDSSSRRSIAFCGHTKLEDFVTQVTWSPDGSQLAAASVSGQVVICSREKEKPLHLWEQAHPDGCDALAWRPDGQALATAGRDGKWKLWDVAEGSLLTEHPTGAAWPEHLAWSSPALDEKGSRLAVSAGNKMSLWTGKGEPAGETLLFQRTISDVSWILGGKTLAVATSVGISLQNPLAGTEERFIPSRDPILCMAFSPSTKWLMTGNQDCSVHVWNTENGAEMHMRGYAAKVRQLAWHRGSRWLATGGGEAISVWDCSGRGPEGRTPTLLEWHSDQISALHYQPLGDWLASGTRDGSVAVWSPTQRHSLVTGGKISSGVTRVAWSPDGKWLAVGGEAGEVQVLAVE